jgi:hypothetical protein
LSASLAEFGVFGVLGVFGVALDLIKRGVGADDFQIG